MLDKLTQLVAVGAGLLQVMISIGLAVIAYQIWKRLDDIDRLKRRVERTERQNALLKRIVTNINAYCNKNDEVVNELSTLVQTLFAHTPRSKNGLRDELDILQTSIGETLGSLRRSKSVIALGSDDEAAVQSSMMFLSQKGRVEDYESALGVLLSREFVETGHSDITSLSTIRQKHLDMWRRRLRDEDYFIVHATWAPPMN